MNEAVETLTPLLLELILGIAGIVISWAAVYAKNKFQIDIEAKHRDALHSALRTGINNAVMMKSSGASNEAIVRAAVEYARKSVPDAIEKLKPSAAILAEIALAKLGEVFEPDQVVVVNPENPV